MNRWNWLDQVTWATQPTERQAFNAWLDCHESIRSELIKKIGDRPSVTDRRACQLWEAAIKSACTDTYTRSTEISSFWESLPGRIQKTIYFRNSQIVRWLKNPASEIRRLKASTLTKSNRKKDDLY